MTDFSARVCRVVGYLFLGKSKCDIPTGLSRGRTACIFIFLVVTVSFVLWGSDKSLVPRYLHVCVCWIQEHQVFRQKPFFFLNVKTWMSSHDLGKWSQEPKETLFLQPLKIQTFHLREIHSDLQRAWQLSQNNTCFDDRWGIGVAGGCLLSLFSSSALGLKVSSTFLVNVCCSPHDVHIASKCDHFLLFQARSVGWVLLHCFW